MNPHDLPESGEWRAVTVKHPWAKSIAAGAKDVENRKRGFPRFWRGPLLIHAGDRWSDRGAEDLRIREWWGEHQGFDPGFPVAPTPNGDLFPRKSIVAVCELYDVHDARDGCCESKWAETRYVESHGVVVDRVLHLMLEDVVELGRPVPCRGKLGLWRPDPEVVASVLDQL